jgi:hypothetical protein
MSRVVGQRYEIYNYHEYKNMVPKKGEAIVVKNIPLWEGHSDKNTPSESGFGYISLEHTAGPGSVITVSFCRESSGEITASLNSTTRGTPGKGRGSSVTVKLRGKKFFLDNPKNQISSKIPVEQNRRAYPSASCHRIVQAHKNPLL